jgi:hypothetical protein
MLFWKYSHKICFALDVILDTVYAVDACALAGILLSLSLIDVIYCTPDTKATPASFQGVDVDLYIDMDFASPEGCETCS